MKNLQILKPLGLCFFLAAAPALAKPTAPSNAALLPGVKLNGAGQVDMSTGYKAGSSSSSYNGHSVPTNWVAGKKAAAALGMPRDMADVLYEIASRRKKTTGRTDPLTRWGQVYSYVLANECSITVVTQWDAWSIEIISHLTTENERLEKAIREMDGEALDALKALLQTLADEIVKRIPGNPGFTASDVAALMSGNGLPNANTIKSAIAGSGDYAGGDGPAVSKAAGKMIDIAVSIGQGNYLGALLGLGDLMGNGIAGSLLQSLNLGNAIADLVDKLWIINTSVTEKVSSKIGIRVNKRLMDWGMAFHTMSIDCRKKLKPVTTYGGSRRPKPPPPYNSGPSPLGNTTLVTPASGGKCPSDRIFVPAHHFTMSEGRHTYKLMKGRLSGGGCLYAGSRQALYDVAEIHQLLGTKSGLSAGAKKSVAPKKSTASPRRR